MSSNGEQIETDKAAWLERLDALLSSIEGWLHDSEWSMRRVDKTMRKTSLGTYVAPCLLLQENAIKVLVEPITHAAPGADGVVDLYLMPEYDDIASLYHEAGEWRLHYMFHDATSVATIREAESRPLDGASLIAVLDEMKSNVAST